MQAAEAAGADAAVAAVDLIVDGGILWRWRLRLAAFFAEVFLVVDMAAIFSLYWLVARILDAGFAGDRLVFTHGAFL